MATDSSSDRDPVERLAEEFLERRRRGEDVTIDEYADRYPEWAEQIREVFPALEMIERLKPVSGDRTGSFDGEGSHLGEGAPERLGDYRIIREVGRGGMGVVYEAVQESLGRHVALKVLPMHGRIDPVQMERFRLEARSAAKLHHTHIVPVHGVGHHEGVHYYAMQFIQGCGLDFVLDDLRRLRSGAAVAPAPEFIKTTREAALSRAVAQSLLAGQSTEPMLGEGEKSAASSSDSSGLSGKIEPGYHRSVARIGVQVAEALAHAHGQGVLHRDIKPSNLLLDADGEAWVTDFGLAKLEGSDGPTRTGDVVGTLRYMAPERFEGKSDSRSDVYGLGITLYEMLTLKPAHDGATRARLIERVLEAAPPSPRKIDPRIPRDLETIVLKAIAKEPGARYSTAKALSEDLDNFLAGKPIHARRVGPVERAWRWGRRNPAAAALVGVSGVAALALVGLLVGLAFFNTLQNAHNDVVKARKDEAATRYFSDMIMAEREWTACNVGHTEQLLNGWVPRRGETDLRGWEWHYLKRQCHTDLKTIPGPPTQAMGLAFSPDDRHIATTGYDDRAVRVWNVQTGALEKTLHRLPEPDGTLCEGLVYSADGTLLAASSGTLIAPGDVVIWEVATWKQRWKFEGVCGESSSVAFSPDGKRLAAVSGEPVSGGTDKKPRLRIWDMKTGEESVKKVEGKEGEMGWISVAFSPNGNAIATASGKLNQTSTENDAGDVKIWNSWTGDLIRILPHSGPLTCVAYSRDGARLATTGMDKTLRIWDAEKGKELVVLRGHTQVPFKVVYSPVGDRLATVSDDNSAKIWDASTLQEILTLRGHTREVHGVAFSSDGRWLATASQDSTVKIWDAETEKNALTLPGRSGDWINGVSFSADGQRIAAAANDTILKVYDTANGQKRREFRGLTDPVWCVAYSPDNHMIATGSGHWNKPETPGLITLWDRETGGVIRTLRAHAGVVKAVEFSPDGTRLATAGGENRVEPGVVKIWDMRTWEEILSCKGHSHGLNAVVYSRDGRYLASAGWDSLVIIWDANTGRSIRTISGHHSILFGLAFSPDGKRLVTAGYDGTVMVWDVATGREVCRFRGHKANVWCVTFSPDGNRVASGGDDGTIKVWDSTTGQEAVTLRGHTDAVLHVEFSPDGNRIASSSKDGTVKIWDGSPWVEPTTPTSSGVQAKKQR